MRTFKNYKHSSIAMNIIQNNGFSGVPFYDNLTWKNKNLDGYMCWKE